MNTSILAFRRDAYNFEVPRTMAVWLHLRAYTIPWHLIFESLAYAVAFRYYSRHRDRAGDFLAGPQRSSIIVAAILGAKGLLIAAGITFLLNATCSAWFSIAWSRAYAPHGQ